MVATYTYVLSFDPVKEWKMIEKMSKEEGWIKEESTVAITFKKTQSSIVEINDEEWGVAHEMD